MTFHSGTSFYSPFHLKLQTVDSIRKLVSAIRSGKVEGGPRSEKRVSPVGRAAAATAAAAAAGVCGCQEPTVTAAVFAASSGQLLFLLKSPVVLPCQRPGRTRVALIEAAMPRSARRVHKYGCPGHSLNASSLYSAGGRKKASRSSRCMPCRALHRALSWRL